MPSCAWAGHSVMMVFCDGENMSRGISVNIDGSFSMAKFGDVAGVCWSMATSEFHGHFASGTATGYVYTCNIYQAKARTLVNAASVVNRLFYNEATNEYRYIDGMGLMVKLLSFIT
jgi:hypothetical protein